MTATEAMARADRIRRMENEIAHCPQLQHEVAMITRIYAERISNIYWASDFTITFRPGGPLVRPVYPPETEQMVAEVKEEARKAIAAHVQAWEERRLSLYPRVRL